VIADSLPDVKLSLRAVNLGVSWIGPGQAKGGVSTLFVRNMVSPILDTIGSGLTEMAMTRSGKR
jgi:hypothetical protein